MSLLPYWDDLPEFIPCSRCDVLTPYADLIPQTDCCNRCKFCPACVADARREDDENE